MHITVNVADDIGKKARKRAKGEGFSSLCGWVSHLVTKEVKEEYSENITLLEALADDETADRDIEFPRTQEPVRGVTFD